MDQILKPLRLEKGWSQEQLAEIAGVSLRTIQRIENGAACSLETAKALAAVFDTKPDTFLHSPEKLPPQQMEQLADIKKRRALRQRFKFYRHLVIYSVTNLLLVIINLNNDGSAIWFHYVLLGWGIGLISHAYRVFFRDWENHLMERLVKKE